jgi:hypothetical protein
MIVVFLPSLVLQQPIQAPRTPSCRGEIEEGEAPEYGEIATRRNGPESLWRVNHEIGYCHLAGEDEGDWPGKEAQQDKESANELEYAGQSHKREERGSSHVRRSPETEELLCAVLHVKKRCHNP